MGKHEFNFVPHRLTNENAIHLWNSGKTHKNNLRFRISQLAYLSVHCELCAAVQLKSGIFGGSQAVGSSSKTFVRLFSPWKQEKEMKLLLLLWYSFNIAPILNQANTIIFTRKMQQQQQRRLCVCICVLASHKSAPKWVSIANYFVQNFRRWNFVSTLFYSISLHFNKILAKFLVSIFFSHFTCVRIVQYTL